VIQQSESDRSVAEYATLQALTTGATYTFTLQRINFKWSKENGTGRGGKAFDVATVPSGFVRAWWEGTNHLKAELYASGSWSDVVDVSSILITTGPTVVCSGSTVRIFYGSNLNVGYRESTDGGETWGDWTQIASFSNSVDFVAPVSLTALHVVTNDGNNSRLHYLEYSGSWSTTDSNVYVPHEFESFDAETLGDKDVIVFACDGPTRFSSQRQGIWRIFYQNGYWSDVGELDVIDEYRATAGYSGGYYQGACWRKSVKLSKIDGKLWATYIGMDDDVDLTGYSVSSDGQNWQLRQPFKDYDWEGKILLSGSYAYLFSDGEMYKSASTVLTGNSTADTDITSRAKAYSATRYGMHQSSIELSNEDGALTSLLDDPNRYQVKEELGYYDGSGNKLTQTVALTEVDTVALNEEDETSIIVLSGRDRLAWMADQVEAEHFETWESQLRLVDLFDSLGHTAVLTGTWSDNPALDELQLISDGEEGFALCTAEAFIGHTIFQCAIKIPSSTAGHYAGLLFRSDSQAENCFSVRYNAGDDKIKLKARSGGAWGSVLAETGAMGWSTDTWYHLRVEAVGQRIQVFYSTYSASDPWHSIDWTLAFTYVDTSYGYEEGYVGYCGKCSSTQYFTCAFVVDGQHSVLIEDTYKALAAYAGIHDWVFGDWSLPWGTASDTGTWSEAGDTIQGTGGGAGQWYWMYSQADSPEAFRLTTKKTGARGAVMFGWGDDYGSIYYRYIYWDSTEIGLVSKTGPLAEKTVATIPRTYANEAELTLSVQRTTEGYIYVSVWFDGELAFTGFIPSTQTDYLRMGLGVYGSDTVTFENFRIPELPQELPVVSLDVGETPLGALQRAIGRRRIHTCVRFDGSLRAMRVKASSGTRTLSDSYVSKYNPKRDKKAHAAHYRQVGAFDSADAYDTDLLEAIGHRFRKDDNPDLMHRDDCEREAAEYLNLMAEGAFVAGITFPYCPFQEIEDRLSAKSLDWILSGYSIQLQAGALMCAGEFRTYVY
jgi:hypothetical protein